ncbi:MAG: pilus assembly protein TadG-related protein, partial [Isosphaeraceae bacterium]
MATSRMIRRLKRAKWSPRGVAATFLAVMLPVFIGFVSLSVDTAVIASARGQLLTAADASALAAALQLASDRRLQGGGVIS